MVEIILQNAPAPRGSDLTPAAVLDVVRAVPSIRIVKEETIPSGGPISAIIIGAVGGFICYSACNLKSKFGYDDSLDVVGVHGVGGTWGALATGLFASKAINPAGNDGLFFGNPGQLWVQFVSVAATIVFAFVVTTVILKILQATMGLRVSEEEERMGLDLTQHNERGYA